MRAREIPHPTHRALAREISRRARSHTPPEGTPTPAALASSQVDLRRSSWGRSKRELREKAARRRRRGAPPHREKSPGRGEEKSPGREEEKSPRRPPSLSLPSHRASLSLSSHRASLSPPPAKHQQSQGASRWKGQASGTRASATQLPRERDPHKAPKLGIPPGSVSPAMCRRSSGHAILCSQGKWGRGGQPSVFTLGSLRPVRGCVEPSITLGTSGCWK